jgi:DNA-binding response OmpR family regulator
MCLLELHKSFSKIFEFAGLYCIAEGNLISNKSKRLSVTNQQFSIFVALYEANSGVVSRDALVEMLSADKKLTVRNVDVHVHKLRRSISELGLKIVSVAGVGYRLEIVPKFKRYRY